jgi:hypothetical protein
MWAAALAALFLAGLASKLDFKASADPKRPLPPCVIQYQVHPDRVNWSARVGVAGTLVTTVNGSGWSQAADYGDTFTYVAKRLSTKTLVVKGHLTDQQGRVYSCKVEAV